MDYTPLLGLPIDQRADLMHALWESLAEEAPETLLQPWHREELDRREAEDAANPTPGIPWREMLDEIRREERGRA